ncbi:DUF4153 domain-containing protein [Saccharothrix violaceirubra]|uniref:Heme exporter protein D n=1 Tax=Saccharothrix violaceirubra TaxID=413306 RepID=A0A7W7WUF1_9PSEU|nr:DUF4153 domain-containing protein [Saccharothrix violaceirubra]MBB4963318.1 heme exporter protein D [Saccharothrix violaceirubra]
MPSKPAGNSAAVGGGAEIGSGDRAGTAAATGTDADTVGEPGTGSPGGCTDSATDESNSAARTGPVVVVPPPSPPGRRDPEAGEPGYRSPGQVLALAAIGGVAAAVAVPLDRPGIGWVLTSLVLFALVRKVNYVWATLCVSLLAIGALHDASWLFVLCVIGAFAAGSLAVARGTSGFSLLVGALAVPISSFRALPWLARRGPRDATSRFVRPVLLTALLLAIFVPLFASADPDFAALLDAVVPDVGGGTIFVFLTAAAIVIGSCFVLVRPIVPLETPSRRRALPRDWAIPVGALVLVFAAFVGVQIGTFFGGTAHVMTTADLTFADYARGGFWQLLAVTVLTLVVITVTAQAARIDTATDRLWFRGLLGTLSVLTLVVVASALTRMWAYQQAYGFTVLRVLVTTIELWLGGVYLLVLAAGIRLSGAWLARAVTVTAMVALLGLAALDPERYVADRNVDRWQATGVIDLRYLADLSDDAVPAFARLPTVFRACLSERRPETPADGWREWNLSRHRARVMPHDEPPCIHPIG